MSDNRITRLNQLRDDGRLAVRGHGSEQYQWADAGDLLRYLNGPPDNDPASSAASLNVSVVELLTIDEHLALNKTAELWNLLCQITGRDHTRSEDLNELAVHIHALQNAVLAQAAARAYPGRYRLAGRTLHPSTEESTR